MLRSASALLAYAALARAWSTYVVPHTEGVDDTPALMAAVSGYTSDASIVFQANTTYNVWSPITFPKLTNVEVVIEGNLSYPMSIETVQGYVGAAVSLPCNLFSCNNTNSDVNCEELLRCLVWLCQSLQYIGYLTPV